MGFFDFISQLFNGNGNKQQAQVIVENANEVVEQIVQPNQISPKTITSGIDLAKVNYKESPNKGNRSSAVLGIVLHHTGIGSFDTIVNWLCNPDAKASAHYVVGVNGEITQLVNTTKSAWHAGVSQFVVGGAIRKNLNDCTVGIEICNPGLIVKKSDGKFYYDGGKEIKEKNPMAGQITYPSGKVLSGYYVPYSDKQVSTVIELCKAIIIKYPQITINDILTHFEIATPEGRKNDPFGLDVEYIKNKIFE